MACSSALFVHHRRVWLQVMEMAFDHLLDRAERPIHLSFDIGACGASGHSSTGHDGLRVTPKPHRRAAHPAFKSHRRILKTPPTRLTCVYA